MARPTHRGHKTSALEVWLEDGVGSDKFIRAPELQPLRVTQGGDTAPTTAELAVVEPRFSLRGTAPVGPPAPRDVVFRLDGNKKLYIVERGDGDEVDDVLLFYGGVARTQIDLKRGLILADGLPWFQEAAPDGQIVGRRMRTASGIDRQATSATDVKATKVATAVRPAFNHEGRRNRAKTFMTDGYKIPIFTYEGDPEAEYWTFAEALTYVLYWYLFSDAAQHTQATRALDLLKTVVDEDEPPAGVEPKFAKAATRQVAGLAIDGMSAIEALAALVNAAGMHFADYVEMSWGGTPSSEIDLWASGGGRLKQAGASAVGGPVELKLQAEGTDTSGDDDDVVAEANVVESLKWMRDFSSIITHPAVYGSTMRFQVTVELVPGWRPEADLDDVADADAAKQKIVFQPTEDGFVNDDWVKKYHTAGAEFKDHRDVGRLWLLNEAGELNADDDETGKGYARSSGPFDADAYKPWDPTKVFVSEAAKLVAGLEPPGGGGPDKDFWVRRRRRFLGCETRDKQGRSYGVHVEVSFDWGITWQTIGQQGAVTVEATRCGVYIEVDNLAKIKKAGSEDEAGNTIWGALIDEKFRMRVTAVIETDDRLGYVNQFKGLEVPPDAIPRAAAISKPETFKFSDASLAENELSSSAGRDDFSELLAFTEKIARDNNRPRLSASCKIPWLSHDFARGTLIKGVPDRGIDFNIGGGDGPIYPEVIGITFDCQAHETFLQIGDLRQLPEAVRV